MRHVNGSLRWGPRIVAHVMSYPPHRRIGAELATHGLLDFLAGCGWRAIAAAHTVPGLRPRRVDGVHLVTPELAYASRPDIVLAHLSFTVQASGHAQRSGAPLVASGHGGPPGWMAAQAAGIDPAPALVLANSRGMATGLERTGLPVHVLRPPIAWPAIRTTPAGDAVTLVNASQAKGGRILRELARRHPSIPFLAVQGGYGLQCRYEDLTNVTVLPHGVPMEQVWERTRLLLMPSEQESWGMVAAEAMARGIPVLASTADGLAECVGPDMPRTDVHHVDLWSARLVMSYEDPGWSDLHIAAIRRAAELDPLPDLLATRRALAELIGVEDPLGDKLYRNVRTGQVVDLDDVAPFVARRIVRDKLVWHPVEQDASGGVQLAGSGPTSESAPGTTSPDPATLSRPGLSLSPATQPKASAPVAEWVEWAVTHGADRKQAEQASKATLIALYGS